MEAEQNSQDSVGSLVEGDLRSRRGGGSDGNGGEGEGGKKVGGTHKGQGG